MSTRYLIGFLEGLPSQQNSLAKGVNGHSPHHATHDQRVKLDELKLLLTEAKEGLDVKNTTSEFYDTLERITNELRGMTEHSTAFLARVRKSDAPDYFNIIKQPMDLGTILKKVKAQQYKDKKAFKADLDLIWDNCLLYNSLVTHPLRKSATILRNRANHLLEFVTDPAAAPAPVLHRPSATRTKRLLSRLDALDASHVISSTAGQISRSSRHMSEDVHSVLSGAPDLDEASFAAEQTDALYPESAPESEAEDDFQDIEDDEEDESIRTRKGLVSLKSQPGGGRNLDLLKGLAAQQPGESTDTSLSVSPSGIDSEASIRINGERGRSTSPGSVKLGTPSPAPATAPAIPDVPGTVPGQGAALLARRATAATPSARRPKPRMSSLPPAIPTVPFHERPALIRTSESMTKFVTLSESLSQHTYAERQQAIDAYKVALQHNSVSDVEATSTIVPLLPLASTSTSESRDSPAPAGASPLVRTRSKQIQAPILAEADLLWWQAAASEQFARSGLPEVPFANAEASSSRSAREASTPKPRRHTPASTMKSDLANLRKVKSLHRRMARLKGKSREMPEESDFSASDDDSNNDVSAEGASSSLNHAENDGGESQTAPERIPRKRKRPKTRLDLLDPPPDIQDRPFSARANQQILSAFCSILLQQTGFDDVQRSALDCISGLLTAYLMDLGQLLAFQRDRYADRLPFGTILRRAVVEASRGGQPKGGPIKDLSHYIFRDLPERSERSTSLASRLEAAYLQEMTAGEAGEAAYAITEDELAELGGDDIPLDKLTRALFDVEYDHLALLALGIDRDSYHFEASFLYSQAFHQLFPSSALAGPVSFLPPPRHIPLSASDSSALSSQIGLLRPFLEARKATEHSLFDDDDLPETGTSVAQQARRTTAAKPDVPAATGRVMLGKRKKEAALTAAAISGAPVVNPAGLGITAQINNAIKAASNVTAGPSPKKQKTVAAVQQSTAHGV